MSIIEKLEQRQKIIGAANGKGNKRLSASGMEIDAASVYRVIQIANKKPYVCITASRYKDKKTKRIRTPEENNKKNQELLADIKAEGFYAYEMVGGTTEGYCKDCGNEMPEDKCEKCGSKEKTEKQVVESSYFIPYDNRREITEFINIFTRLRDKYEQEAILVGLPKAFDYEDWKPILGMEIGNHYGVYPSKVDSYGSEATMKTFDKFGSIAIDPKKNRTIDWVVAGVSQPQGSMGAFGMHKWGLRWFWDDLPEVKASDFEGETKQRAVQKILDSHKKRASP